MPVDTLAEAAIAQAHLAEAAAGLQGGDQPDFGTGDAQPLAGREQRTYIARQLRAEGERVGRQRAFGARPQVIQRGDGLGRARATGVADRRERAAAGIRCELPARGS